MSDFGINNSFTFALYFRENNFKNNNSIFDLHKLFSIYFICILFVGIYKSKVKENGIASFY